MLKFWLICVEKSSRKITPKTTHKPPPHQPFLGFSTTFLANVNKQNHTSQLVDFKYFMLFFNITIVTTLFLCC